MSASGKSSVEQFITMMTCVNMTGLVVMGMILLITDNYSLAWSMIAFATSLTARPMGKREGRNK